MFFRNMGWYVFFVGAMRNHWVQIEKITFNPKPKLAGENIEKKSVNFDCMRFIESICMVDKHDDAVEGGTSEITQVVSE